MRSITLSSSPCRRAVASLALMLLAVAVGHAAERYYPTQCTQRLGDDGPAVEVRWHDVRERALQRLDCAIELPGDYAEGTPVGVFANGSFSARFLWDGVVLGAKGTPGADAEQERPGPLSAVMFLPPSLLGPGRHELSLEWSAHYAANVYSPIDLLYLGPYQDPLLDERARYLPAMLTVGTLVLAIVYLLLLSLRAADRPSLWLAGACAALLVQLVFEVTRAYVNYPYDWHVVRLSAVTVAAGVATFCLLAYLCERFERPKAWIWSIIPIGLLTRWLVPSPDAVTLIIIASGLLAGIVVAGQARLAGDRTAQPTLYALLFVASLLVLGARGFLDLGLYLGYALLLLALCAEQVSAVRRERDAKQQAEVTSARLRAELLKRNLNPHFLMNTLTTLSEWIETSPPTAVAMINALSEEFRHLAQVAEESSVPLAQEIDLCRRHLQVMGYRHERQYALAVQGATQGMTVPPAILHTLVENALTHGRYRSDTTLSLIVDRLDDKLTLWLRAPSGNAKPAQGERRGTGMRYVEARLQEAYGSAWSLRAGATEDGGWSTEIRCPAVAP